MREITRREICVGLSALAATGGAVVEAQTAAAPTGAATLSQAKVYPFEQMPVRKMANGGESRDVLRGTLTTGEVIAVHESQQPEGMAPNTLHTIKHSEVMVVVQGTLLFEHDGKSDKVGPGGRDLCRAWNAAYSNERGRRPGTVLRNADRRRHEAVTAQHGRCQVSGCSAKARFNLTQPKKG